MHDLYERTVACRNIAETHPFINAVGAGEVSKAALLFYFQGMYWHGKMIGHY
jgi:pyrroloquinoline quinone (PQQ) biosynthesis protein C